MNRLNIKDIKNISEFVGNADFIDLPDQYIIRFDQTNFKRNWTSSGESIIYIKFIINKIISENTIDYCMKAETGSNPDASMDRFSYTIGCGESFKRQLVQRIQTFCQVQNLDKLPL